MKIMSKLLRNTGISLSGLLLFIVYSPLTFAQSSSTIAQSFKISGAKDDIVTGALVSAQSGEKAVKLATLSTTNQLVGVIDNNPLVSLSEGDQQIEVVLSGTTNVLVSDINGVIKSGDKIAVSPVAGVGMKATNDGQIVGTAQGSFSTATTRSVADQNGKYHDIHLGYVRAQIGVATYQAPNSSFLPPFIQGAANAIAGQSVSLIRVLICSALLVLGFTAVVILVYTSARSAMTSLGRNPLASHAIRRGLYQVSAISIVIVAAVLLASYLILIL
jgi:hypothetical protein